MIDDSEEFKNIIYTVIELVKADKLDDLTDLLINSQITIQQTSYDSWNGGRYSYTIYLAVDVTRFIALREKISSIEDQLGQMFDLVTRHLDDQDISRITLIPKASAAGRSILNPHRPLSSSETTRRNHLIKYLLNASEDELIMEVLVPLFRQLGFQRLTVAGHKDKALEYGKDIWMKFILPTQHILYFGIQAKKGKLDSSGMSKATNTNVAEIYNQVSMMLGHEIFDPEIGKRVLVDHAFMRFSLQMDEK